MSKGASSPVPIAFLPSHGQVYSEQVLQWQLGQTSDIPLPHEDAARASQHAERLLAAALRAGHSHIVLLGLGDGTMAHYVQQGLPAGCTLLVLEDQPAVARAAVARYSSLLPHVLVDTSPWALFLLGQALGLPRAHCSLGYNPAYPRKTAGQQEDTRGSTGLPVLEQWRRLFLGAQAVTLPTQTTHITHVSHISHNSPMGGAARPRLSVACIAHPDESLLADFFSHIPPWVDEVIIVWDGQAPAHLPPCAVPLRQTVRPLNGDFAAQRNGMLDMCTGDWCLYLDVDERLDSTTWAALPAWLTLPTTGPEAVGAMVLPRLTFMGDSDHVRMGYGLWPDVQMRLFPLREGLRFVGRVHEKVTGLHGATILVGGHGIWHYSHIRKDALALRERLQVFNAAASGACPVTGAADPAEDSQGPIPTTAGLRHVLSAAYPRLPVAYFTALHGLWQGAWRLPV